MAGEKIYVADKPTLDAVKAKVDTLTGGSNPAAVWNAAKFGDWTLTDATIDADGIVLKDIDTISTQLKLSTPIPMAGWQGVKVTPVVNTALVSISAPTNATYACPFRVVRVSDNVTIYSANRNTNTEDFTANNIQLEAGQAYYIEYQLSASYSRYETNVAADVAKFIGNHDSVTVNGTYQSRNDGSEPETLYTAYVILIEAISFVFSTTTGNALSPTIPRDTVAHWGKLSAMLDAPVGSSILFDVEKTDGTKLLTDLTGDADLSTLPLYDVKVRAKFSRTDTSVQPKLKSVMVDWAGVGQKPTPRKLYSGSLSVNSSSYVTVLNLTGSGKLLGLAALFASYNLITKVTIDGNLISWGKTVGSSLCYPTANWAFTLDSATAVYDTQINGGSQQNCQLPFSQSLKIEVSTNGARTLNWLYEMD